MMKKILALLLVGVLSVFVLVGCAKSSSGFISEKEARTAALNEIPDAKDEDISSCVLNEANKNYEVTILYDGIETIIQINAEDGSLLRAESETVTAGNSDAGQKPADMGKEAIKKIALGEVDGAVDEEIKFCEILPDKKVYQVVIDHNNKSHALQIDAQSGEIILHDEKQN